MDLRRLEVFCKIMALRSFSRTAEELGLTQPTVSGHIKTLEEEIGLRLFDRFGRQVTPTSAAMVLLDYAQRMLELRVEAQHALEQFQGRMSGRLRLGGSTIPGGYILPLLIGKFCRMYPEANLNLVLSDTHGIINRIVEGDVEIGMVGAQVAEDGLEYEPVVEDEMVLALPPDHAWAKSRKTVAASELARVPFIIREEGSGTRAATMSALANQGLGVGDLKVVAEMGSTEAVLQAVKAGLGMSVISRIALADQVKLNLIKTVSIEGVDLKRQFYLVKHKKRTHSPLCKAFWEFARHGGQDATDRLTEK